MILLGVCYPSEANEAEWPKSSTSPLPGRLYQATVDENFTDPDGDVLHFSPVGTWPAGMTISDTGAIDWIPTASEITDPSGTGANPLQIEVQASDDRGGTATLNFPVSVGYYAPPAPYLVAASGGGGNATIIWANTPGDNAPGDDVLGYKIYDAADSNTPYNYNAPIGDLHKLIGLDPAVFSQVESDLDNYFGQLSE